MRYIVLVLFIWLLSSCGTTPAPSPDHAAEDEPEAVAAATDTLEAPAPPANETAPPQQEYRFLTDQVGRHDEERPPTLMGVLERAVLSPSLDASGEPMIDAVGDPVLEKTHVLEAWFEGYKRPFRVGDRISGTEWVIAEVFIGKRFKDEHGVRVRSGVLLTHLPE